MIFIDRFHIYFVILVILISGFGAVVSPTAVEEKSKDEISFIIQLEGRPILLFEVLSRDTVHSGHDVSSYALKIESQHERVKSMLRERISGVKILYDYTRLFNGMAVEVPKVHVSFLKQLPEVVRVYPNEEVHPDIDDSVPLINGDDVWPLTNDTGAKITGKDVLVSVVDSGIDYDHPDLGGGFGPGYRVVGGYDYINNDPDPMDDMFHGTHCAGIIGANGSKKGVAPDVKFLAYKIFNAIGGGGDWGNVIAAIEASADPDGDPATDDAADVISMSLGGGGDPDSPICQASDNAFMAGIIVVSSAGNSGPGNGTIGAPACSRRTIAVGSTDKSDDIVYLSSRGPSSILAIKPNILAPGDRIDSTMPGGGYSEKSGTSMACPHVSGVAALVIQAHRDWDQNVTRAAVINTAVDLGYHVNWEGTGRVEAYEAVNAEAVIIPDSVSFGIVDVKEVMWYKEEELKIVNTLDSPSSYDIQISMDPKPGVSVTLNTSHVELAPEQTAYFKLNITLDNSQALEYCYEGRILANSTTENLSVPFFFMKENLTVLATPNPSNGQTEIMVFSPVDLVSLDVTIDLPDQSSQGIPMFGWGKEWTGTFTVTQNGAHIINASSTDGRGRNNTGSTILMGDLIPPDFTVTADPDPADYFTFINITANEPISGTWSPDERITINDGLESMNPHIAIDSNDILHMVWPDDEGDGKNSIFYMRYDGDDWKDKQIIGDPTTGGHGAFNVRLAVDSNDFVHAIFHEALGNWWGRMYYCKINGSNGTVVEPYFNITSKTNFLFDKQSVSDMAVDSANRIHAVGRFFVNGEYASYILLDNNGTILDYDLGSRGTAIEIDTNDNIHMLYLDEGEVYYYRYDHGTWTEFTRLSDGGGNHESPDLKVDREGNLHLVYLKYGDGIYYRKFCFSNSTWCNRTKLNTHSYTPVIAPDEAGNLHVIYRGYWNKIYYKKFDAVKSKWEPELKISRGESLSMEPKIALDSLYNLYVIWYDYRDNENEELYWAKYRSSPYYRITQPEGSNLTFSMSQTDIEGMNFTSVFYPTQDGTHHVNATGIDLAGNIGWNTTSFEALVPPFVSDPTPNNGAHTSNTKHTISATLWDYSGVNTNTVIIYVNGTNVTSDAIITPTSVSYTPSEDLAYGLINVSIICADNHGNSMKNPYNWTFWVDREPPSPTGLLAYRSGDDIVLTWNAPNSPDIDHYLIFKRFKSSGFDFIKPYHNTSLDPNPLSTSWTDVDAASNWSTCYYIVRVVDINGKNDSNENMVYNGDWVVLTTQYHSDKDVVLNGNLYVKGGGDLTLDNFTLRMNSTDSMLFEIKVISSFSAVSEIFIINGSNITSNSQYKYDLNTWGQYARIDVQDSVVEKGRNILYDQYTYGSVVNSVIRNFDRFQTITYIYFANNSVINTGQIWILHTSTIVHNTFLNCGSFITTGGSTNTAYVADNNFNNLDMVQIMHGSNPYIYNNTITSASWYGLYVFQASPLIEKNLLQNNDVGIYCRDGSAPTILNCTIIGGSTHIRLNENSNPVAINTTFNISKVSFDDALSSLTIKWYMHVFVKDVHGEPIEGAGVSVINVTDGNFHTGTTDQNGYVGWLICTGSIMKLSEVLYYELYNVTATKDTLTGYAEPEPIMNRSKKVDVILGMDMPPESPMNLKIEINGNDILLSWEGSPSKDIVGYHIFRADSPHNFDFDMPWRNTTDDSDNGKIPLRTSWNDTGAASVSNNYFYVVRAIDGAWQNDNNTLTVGKFVIPLVKGWNLISIPLAQQDTYLPTVLSSIAGEYDLVMYYDVVMGQWKTTSSGLTDVDRTMALWIHMKQTDDLVVVGTVPERTFISLTSAGEGWNFIGYPCFQEKSVIDALSIISGSYDAVRGYDGQDTSDPWRQYHEMKPPQMNDLDVMKPGCGYWIHVTSDCVLTLSP